MNFLCTLDCLVLFIFLHTIDCLFLVGYAHPNGCSLVFFCVCLHDISKVRFLRIFIDEFLFY